MSKSAANNSAAQRVVILDHTAALGGGEIALLNLVKVIRRDGAGRYEVIVVLFAEGPLVERLKEIGCDVRIVPLDASVSGTRKDTLGAKSVLHPGRLLKSLGFIRRLRSELEKLRPALVHTNSLKSDILGGSAARLARLKVVWHIRDRIVPEYIPARVVRIFRRLCRRIPHYLVANSASTLATLQLPASYTRDHKRACVVHDGVETQKLETQKLETRNLKLETPLTIGIVGRISPWKGQHIFLQAAAAVRQSFPHARFLIIGAPLFDEAAYEKQIQELTDQLALRDAVEFTGFRPDILPLIATLDILVHASTLGEPFGQVVAEGMAAGKPVVATRGGGVPEIITDGTGLLVPMGNAPEMAAAILRLCQDPALREKIGAAGRRRIEQHFPIERTAADIMAVWDHLLG